MVKPVRVRFVVEPSSLKELEKLFESKKFWETIDVDSKNKES